MPMPPPAMPPPSPPLGMPAYPGHAGDDHGYPGRDDPADYYGPDDEDEDPGWAGAEYPDAGGDYPGQPGGAYDPEWADEEEYGPGPGPPPYPHADTSRSGWTR
jgi:hypothetical protein